MADRPSAGRLRGAGRMSCSRPPAQPHFAVLEEPDSTSYVPLPLASAGIRGHVLGPDGPQHPTWSVCLSLNQGRPQ